MDRWTGLLVAATLAMTVDFAIIATLGWESPRAITAWWIANFPSLPFVACCMSGVPIAPGDDNEPAVELAEFLAFFWSLVTWGAIGWMMGRNYEKREAPHKKPQDDLLD
jgi:hypothetical protein